MVAALLSGPLKLTLPAWEQVRVESGELTEITPTEYRADAAVVFTAADRPVLAVVSEVQLNRDRTKRWSWPTYVANLRARLRCPTILLVICPDPATAGWCATPIDIGHPDWVLRPLVVGPAQVPVVTDPRQAGQTPELAVLSAIAHGAGPEQERIFRATLSGLQTVDQEHLDLYTDLMLAVLPEAARHCLEEMVNIATYEPQSDFFRRRIAQAAASAAAQAAAQADAAALLSVLAARDIEVTDDARDLITSCTDLVQFEDWIRRAATASSLADVFD